jgi:polar amino acid transport system ATP-binding protein
MIQIAQVVKTFDGAKVLAGVSATLDQGKIACLIGPSGCGKTTLLRCMNGLERIDSGTIHIAGCDISADVERATLRRVRQEVGFVFQDFHLFPHLTALENITLAPMRVRSLSQAAADKRGRELLERVGLGGREGARPAELSGGQKQRVAIARALALDVKVLLLDEPTSALDPEMREEVRDVLRDVARQGLTMLCATHDMPLVTSLADVIWVFESGNIAQRVAPSATAL